MMRVDEANTRARPKRAIAITVLVLAASACASNGGSDARSCADWVIENCPPPPPPTPAHFDPPTVACGPGVDAGVADPCAAWFDCVPSDVDAGDPWGAWGTFWSGGSCVAGSCVFTTDPIVQYCYGGCSLHTGVNGRCTHVGPTAP